MTDTRAGRPADRNAIDHFCGKKTSYLGGNENLGRSERSAENRFEPVNFNMGNKENRFEPVTGDKGNNENRFEPVTGDKGNKENRFEPVTG